MKQSTTRYQTSAYNETFPSIPSTSMEVDGDQSSKIKVPTTFATAVNMVTKEKEEIQKRKLQLVLTNLKEAGSVEGDKKQVIEIFEYLNVNANVTDVMRLGNRKPKKDRVLRVSLDNFEDKRKILGNATTLRNLPRDHKYGLVYVKPNLTPQQQEESKNLWLQLVKVREKNPTKTYKIS